MLQMMKDIGGVEMPEYFGKVVGEERKTADKKPSKGGKDRTTTLPVKGDGSSKSKDK
jgi:hypothetical protein